MPTWITKIPILKLKMNRRWEDACDYDEYETCLSCELKALHQLCYSSITKDDIMSRIYYVGLVPRSLFCQNLNAIKIDYCVTLMPLGMDETISSKVWCYTHTEDGLKRHNYDQTTLTYYFVSQFIIEMFF